MKRLIFFLLCFGSLCADFTVTELDKKYVEKLQEGLKHKKFHYSLFSAASIKAVIESDSIKHIRPYYLNDMHFDTPNLLHVSAALGELETFKHFEKRGLDIEATTRGMTVLAFAVESGNVELVQYLIDKGIFDLAYKNDAGQWGCDERTYMDFAIRGGSLDIVKLLEASGVPFTIQNERQEGRERKKEWLSSGNVELITYLLERLPLTFRDEDIQKASQLGQQKLYVFLNQQKRYSRPKYLMDTMMSGNIEMTQYLIGNGYINDPKTWFYLAWNESGEASKSLYLLRKSGVDFLLNSGRYCHQAELFSRWLNLDQFKFFIDSGVPFKTLFYDDSWLGNPQAEKIYDEFVANKLEEIFPIIARKGVFKKALDRNQISIFRKIYNSYPVKLRAKELVVMNGSRRFSIEQIKVFTQFDLERFKPFVEELCKRSKLDSVKYYFENYGHLFTKDSKELRSALFKSIEYNNFEVSQYLLDYGIDPNYQNSRNVLSFVKTATPLTAAVRNQNIDLVKQLLEKGADPFVKDEFKVLGLGVYSENSSMALTTLDWLRLEMKMNTSDKRTIHYNEYELERMEEICQLLEAKMSELSPSFKAKIIARDYSWLFLLLGILLITGAVKLFRSPSSKAV